MKKAKHIATVILIVIGAILVLQNTRSVETSLLWYDITMPLAVLLLSTGVIGFALGIIVCFGMSRRP